MKVRRFARFAFLVCMALLVPLVASSPVKAAPAADAENVEFVGHIGGGTYAVAVQGNYAYIGEGPSLTILDISNPASPTLVARTPPLYSSPPSELIRDVAVAGGYAYLIGYGGLRVVDVSTPDDPMEVGFYDTPGEGEFLGVAVAGNYVYVADGDGGLVILWFAPLASTSIASTGGSLASAADQTTYTFPSDTFTDTVIITHTIPYSGNVPAPTGDLASIGHAFNVTGTYTTTGQAAQPAPGQTFTVTVQYTDTEISTVDEGSLGLYWWDGGAWSQEGITSSVNTTDNLVRSQVDHLSLFAVLGAERRRLFLPLILKNY